MSVFRPAAEIAQRRRQVRLVPVADFDTLNYPKLMTTTLVFPDGVRLANREEIPGPDDHRVTMWARIQASDIVPGFVLNCVNDKRFMWYAESNVDAPTVWAVFCDLCRTLLEPEATLLFAEIDDEPRPLGCNDITTIINVLERHEYQLVHDGVLQFGAVSDKDGVINEVLVAATKHLKIWLNDEMRFRSVMGTHGIPEASQLEFLDEYPRTTVTLPLDRGVLRDIGVLAARLKSEVGVKPRPT